MQNTVAQIAQKIQGALIGNETIQISSLNGLDDAQAGDLSFLGACKSGPCGNLQKSPVWS